MSNKLYAKLTFLALIGILCLIPPLTGSAEPKWSVDRTYYLTRDTYQPTEALTACEDGYHMASIFEIWDFSNLRYSTELGLVQEDSGLGPPSGYGPGVGSPPIPGWVRSGFADDDNSSCSTWTSNGLGDNGTVASPSIANLLNGVNPWDIRLLSCTELAYVWCVSD